VTLHCSSQTYAQSNKVTLCGNDRDSLTIVEILDCGKLTINDPDLYIVNYWFKSTNYDSFIVSSNEYFADIMKSLIKTSRKGEELIFENITVMKKGDVNFVEKYQLKIQIK